MVLDLELHSDNLLKRVEQQINLQLERQYQQLTQGLQVLLGNVSRDPFETRWRDEVAMFADHWRERGLALTPRTLDDIERLILEELTIDDVVQRNRSDGANLGEAEREAIFLAAAPRKPQARKGTSAATPAGKRGTPSSGRFPRGTWVKGAEGTGILELESPITLQTGTVVKRVPYKDGMPIFDQWSKSVDSVMIAMTGEQFFDQAAARDAWEHANPTRSIDSRFVFHHDGHVVDIGTHRGKKVFAGRMQLIPAELNALAHRGSAVMARAHAVERHIAREVNALALQDKGPLAGKLGRSLARKAKRIGKFIPIIGGAITLATFADDVEAHGVAGAAIRATPLLGDVVSAYDLGKDMAAEIHARAEQELRDVYDNINVPIQRAHAEARQSAVVVFNAIAQHISIENRYMTSEDIVDSVKEALTEYYGQVFLEYAKHFRQPHAPAGLSPDAKARIERARTHLENDLKKRMQPQEPLSSNSFT